MSRDTGVPAGIDTVVLFKTLRAAIDLRRSDLSTVIRAVNGNARAERAVGALLARLDRLHGLLYMLGATDVEPEEEVLRMLEEEGAAVRDVPQYAFAGGEAGNDCSEE